MIGRRPGPRHHAVLRTTAGRGRVGEGQRRRGIARVAGRRRREAGRGRTFNRRRPRQRRDRRRDRVHHVDHLAGRRAVAAMIGRRPGPRHHAVLRTTAGRGRVGEGQRRIAVARVAGRRRREAGRGRTFNRRRPRQRRDRRRDRVHHVDHLAGRRAVAAVVGRRPGPRHHAVLRTTAGRGRVGEGQRRRGIACVARRRRREAGRGRTFNRRRPRQRRDRRRDRVHHVDHLAGRRAVAAVIGRRPGPRHHAVLRTTAGRGRVGEGQRRRGIARVAGRRRREAGRGRTFNRRRPRQRRDRRRDRVHHVDHLAGRRAVAAMIGRRPGPRHHAVLRTTAGRGRVGERQRRIAVARVAGRRRREAGRGRTFNRRRPRQRRDRRRDRVHHVDHLAGRRAVAAVIGRRPGPRHHAVLRTTAGRGRVGEGQRRRGIARVAGRRRREAGRGRTFNRRRPRQRRDRRRDRVHHVDHLAGRRAVAAMIGRRPGPRHHAVLRTTAGRGRVGERQRRIAVARVAGRRRREAGRGRTFNRRRPRQRRDRRRDRVHHVDHLAGRRAVAAVIGRRPGPRHHAVLRTTAGRGRVGEGQRRRGIARVAGRRRREAGRGRTFNRRRPRQRRDRRRDRVHHVDHLAGRRAVAAMIGRRPGPRHHAVLRTTAGRGRVGERQRRIAVARVAGRRRREAGRGRTFNRRRPRQRRDRRRDRVHHVDHLAGRRAVAAVIGRRPGPRHHAVLRTTAGRGRVGEGQRRRGIARVAGRRRREAGRGRTFNRRRPRQRRDRRRDRVHHVDHLAGRRAVAAMIGRRPGPRHHAVLRTTAGRGRVGEGQRRIAVARVAGRRRREAGRGRTFNRRRPRQRRDRRRDRVHHVDHLAGRRAVAAVIGRRPGPRHHAVLRTTAGRGRVGEGQRRIAVARVAGRRRREAGRGRTFNRRRPRQRRDRRRDRVHHVDHLAGRRAVAAMIGRRPGPRHHAVLRTTAGRRRVGERQRRRGIARVAGRRRREAGRRRTFNRRRPRQRRDRRRARVHHVDHLAGRRAVAAMIGRRPGPRHHAVLRTTAGRRRVGERQRRRGIARVAGRRRREAGRRRTFNRRRPRQRRDRRRARVHHVDHLAGRRAVAAMIGRRPGPRHHAVLRTTAGRRRVGERQRRRGIARVAGRRRREAGRRRTFNRRRPRQRRDRRRARVHHVDHLAGRRAVAAMIGRRPGPRHHAVLRTTAGRGRVGERQRRIAVARVAGRRRREAGRGRTFNRRRPRQRRDRRRDRVHHVDHLAGRRAVAAVVGRRPGPRHHAVLRTTAGRGRVGEGQRRIAVAGVAGRRRREAGRRRTFNRRDPQR